jgi:hypothetical protein
MTVSLPWSVVEDDTRRARLAIAYWRLTDRRSGCGGLDHKSRRALAPPERCVDALRKQRAQQTVDRLAAPDCQEMGLVYTTELATEMDAANVRLAPLSPWCTSEMAPGRPCQLRLATPGPSRGIPFSWSAP